MVFHDRSLIGPPLLDDLTSSTIEHDHAPRARMDGWWTCAVWDFTRTHHTVHCGDTRIYPGRSSSILGQMRDRISQHIGLRIEMPRRY